MKWVKCWVVGKNKPKISLNKKKLANSGEATDVVPVIVDPVQVELALTIVEVQIADVAVTIPVLPDGAVILYKISSVALPID